MIYVQYTQSREENALESERTTHTFPPGGEGRGQMTCLYSSPIVLFYFLLFLLNLLG